MKSVGTAITQRLGFKPTGRRGWQNQDFKFCLYEYF